MNKILLSGRRLFSTSAPFRPRRSFTYVPGSSEKMLGKSPTLPADTICLDLEDGVADNAKQTARDLIQKALATYDYGSKERIIRINALSTSIGIEDLRDVLSRPILPDGICIPKLDTVEELTLADALLRDTEVERGLKEPLVVIGIIESAAALMSLKDIVTCKASHRLKAIIFGGDDYAHTVGATRTKSNHELQFARNWVLLHAASRDIQAIDIVMKNFRDHEALRKECQEASELGFTGKQIIHPSQIEHANELFSPSKELMTWAKRVVEANEHHQKVGTGAFDLDGVMIDMPTVKLAEKTYKRGIACGYTFPQ